jgi:pimeloyl-ACP methyl ester carboxylesterase
MRPETRYAQSGDVNIAYQVVGDGPRILVVVPGWVSNIDLFREEPHVTRFLKRLASFSRLILFDKRGTGLSDRVPDMPSSQMPVGAGSWGGQRGHVLCREDEVHAPRRE